MPGNTQSTTHEVPWRTILAVIGSVVATVALYLFVRQTWPILQLIFIAAFFALVLNPAVDLLQYKVKMRRGLATFIVFILGVAAIGGLAYLFVRPIVEQTQIFISSLPSFFQDATNGRGWVGELVERYDLDRYVIENQSRLQDALTSSTSSVIDVASTIFATIASLVTVLVLSFMMLLEGPRMLRVPLILFEKQTQDRIRAVAADASKAVTGYTAGQLLMCVLAGTVAYATMRVLDVPYALVLAVWVAFCALIPLIGSFIGALGTVGVSFLHDLQSGIIAFIVYVIYQQLENNFVQPSVMSRTVRLNPLTVLVSVLIGVQLAGVLGAILAIPAAGAMQVVGRDIIDRNRGRLKSEPTIGEDEIPVSKVLAEEEAEKTDGK